MVICVLCGKGFKAQTLLSDSTRAVRDFYIAHLNPLLDTDITLQTVILWQTGARQPRSIQQISAKLSKT